MNPLVALGAVLAGICACCLSLVALDLARVRHAQEALREKASRYGIHQEDGAAQRDASQPFQVRLLVSLASKGKAAKHQETASKLKFNGSTGEIKDSAAGITSNSNTGSGGTMSTLIMRAGLAGVIDPRVLGKLRLHAGLALAAAACLVAWAVAPDFACAVAGAGFLVGYTWPTRTLSHEADRRKSIYENELPDMLDIIALCAQAGMSFDASFEMYANQSDLLLSDACRRAYLAYQQGIMAREDALTALAAELSIDEFSRFVSTVVQALRFGSPLASSMRELAREMREEKQAQVSEKVAKAPVKMLVPTGTLILPAMLLLVLGPAVLSIVGETV